MGEKKKNIEQTECIFRWKRRACGELFSQLNASYEFIMKPDELGMLDGREKTQFAIAIL